MQSLKEKQKEEEQEKIKRILLGLEKYALQYENLQSSFDYIRLSVASSKKIKSWSTKEIWGKDRFRKSNKIELLEEIGQIESSETVHFRDFTPINGGLFCEKIFGPSQNWICQCKELRGFFPDKVCSECFVELIDSRVRRYRMGRIELYYPVAHLWFLKGRPCYLEQFLERKRSLLEEIFYYKRDFKDMVTDDPYSMKSGYEESFSLVEIKKEKEKALLYPFYYYTFKNPTRLAYFYELTRDFITQDKIDINLINDWKVKKKLNLAQYYRGIILKIKLEKDKIPTTKELQKIYKGNKFIYREALKEKRGRLKALLFFEKKLSEKLKTEIKVYRSINSISKIKTSINFLENTDLSTGIDYWFEFLSLIKPSFPTFNKYDHKVFFQNLLDEIARQTNKKLTRKEIFTLVREKYSQEKLETYALSDGTSLVDYTIFGLNPKYKGMHSKKPGRHRYGGEIVLAMLEDLNLKEEIKTLKENISLPNLSLTKSKRYLRRIRILESFLATNTSPSSLLLKTLPVLPPTLRPLRELENGKLISADINEVYRLIMTRLNRLEDSEEYDMTLIHNARLIQEAVDCLIDNARLAKNKMMVINNRPLKTLTEILEGKEGRFRQSLLGKRVDYSGRSVIIVGPELKLNQCGLPYEMGKVLFEPFLISKLLELESDTSTAKLNKRLAKTILKKNKPVVWSLLFKLSKNYSILLNRAPTLHKFGIQAFDPLIVLGEAIQLHPLVCTGFNADFDGDQMAVHLPLYHASQLEVKNLLKASANVLSPSNGEVILKPSQDIVIGSYYLTFLTTKEERYFPKYFGNSSEVILALLNKKINLQNRILVRYPIKDFNFTQKENKLIFSADFFPLFEKTVSFLEIIKGQKENFSSYFLTDIGIFIGKKLTENNYLLTDLFLDTTPGRIIFGMGLKESRKYP